MAASPSPALLARRRRSARVLVAGLAALLALSHAALAQELRGTVSDSASGQPIPGVVLLLLDSAGHTLGRNITNEIGAYRVARLPALRRVRVMRIGYRPREVSLPATRDGSAPFDLRMVSIPVLLEPVRVTTTASRCPRRGDGLQALALLEQARAGLLAVIVAREANPAALVRLGYQRRMDGTSNRIVRQTVRRDSAARAAVSFDAVRTPEQFLRLGFAADRWGEKQFLAPDADVLLSDAFAQGYCFRLAGRERDRPHQVGLGFTAADRAEGRIDIDGTLWVDTVARTLVDVTFRYVRLEGRVESLRPGGSISFRTMPNGLVLIDRWVLRLVGIEQDSVPDARTRMFAVRNWYQVAEAGGELARATWADGRVWRASLGRARIHAATRVGAPAADVALKLDSTPYVARTDSSGVAEFADLVPGPYQVVVMDPRLAELRLELATGARFVASRDSTIELTFTLPTAADTTARRCERDRRLRDTDSVWVLGRVLEGSRPVEGALIRLNRVLPPPLPEVELASYTTGSDGLFQFCQPTLELRWSIAVQTYVHGEFRSRVVRMLEQPLTIVRVPLSP